MSIPHAPSLRPRPAVPVPPLDVGRLRKDFPILQQIVHGQPLVYFDNASTTQKPLAVIDTLRRFYSADNANVHRGVYLLSERATRDYEAARERVRQLLGAADSREIIFVRGTTEGINLVAQSWGRSQFKPGDEILITGMEHHSNIVPWQILCEQTGAQLRVIPLKDNGELLLEDFEQMLSERTRLVSVVHLSNSLGTLNPIRQIIERAHARGAVVLIDAAQSVAHQGLDVQELGCDFLVFSGHKMYGPTGIGTLYGKAALLERMPPWQGGGDMIKSVTFARTVYADIPSKLEAGTPHIAGAIGLAAAIDYLQAIGLERIAAHEEQLLRRATEGMSQIRGLRLIGTAPHKGPVLSFVVEAPPISSLDIGTRLDLEGIAIRTGHHCCQPVMDRFGIAGTARASFGLYNTLEEVDLFVSALQEIVSDASGRARPTSAARADASYPRASAASPQAAADELAEDFDLLEDWADRYQYILGLGEKLAPLPNEMRTDANRVRGCQSTVFLSARKHPGVGDVLEFLADSDADLVRGLIGVLQRVYSGQKAADVVAFDVEGFFARIGLDQHLTLGRRNGLAAMVQRIRDRAAELVRASRE
jgi:cysteine desulfurase/selenocysteine lyase